MKSSDDFERTKNDDGNVKDEPKIENDYTGHPEIEAPNPSTATPSIPAEMPPR